VVPLRNLGKLVAQSSARPDAGVTDCWTAGFW
jgi:hypothetical protein